MCLAEFHNFYTLVPAGSFHSSFNWVGVSTVVFLFLSHHCRLNIWKPSYCTQTWCKLQEILISKLMPWLDETFGMEGLYFICWRYVNYWDQRIDWVTQLLQMIAPCQSIILPSIHGLCTLLLHWLWAWLCNFFRPWGHQQTWGKQRLINLAHWGLPSWNSAITRWQRSSW